MHRGLHARALQPFPKRSGVSGEQPLRYGHARKFGVEARQSGPGLRDAALSLTDVHAGRLHLLRIERNLLARSRHDDEPHGSIRPADLGQGILRGPSGRILVEKVALRREIAQHHPVGGQRPDTRRVESPPRAQLLGGLLQPADLGLQGGGFALRRGITCIRLLARSERRGLRVEASCVRTERLQELGGPGAALNVEHQLAILLRRLPACRGDVHQPQFAQPPDEIVALRRIEHKSVFGHFRDHSIAPSPAACCLVFTIFWADFERFSSSSMKRLIFRMASS